MSGKKLYAGQPGTSAASVYTSTNQTTQITAATATNTTSTATTITAYIVASGGAETDAGAMIINAVDVGASTQIGLGELVGHILDPGEQIYLKAGTAAALDVRISGVTGV